MAIGEQTRSAASDAPAVRDVGADAALATSEPATNESATSVRPRMIQTWPLSTSDFASDAPGGAPGSGEAPERLLVVPETVQGWPLWLQRQWVDQQRRRLWQGAHRPSLASRVFSPAGTLVLSALLIVALLSFGLGALARGGSSSAPATSYQPRAAEVEARPAACRARAARQ